MVKVAWACPLTTESGTGDRLAVDGESDGPGRGAGPVGGATVAVKVTLWPTVEGLAEE